MQVSFRQQINELITFATVIISSVPYWGFFSD